MKKVAAFILALLYLSVSTGATVHFSYCMGKRVEGGLFQGNSGKCGYCGMDMNGSNGCCKEEITQLKIDNDQTVPAAGIKIPDLFPVFISMMDDLLANHLYHVIIFARPVPAPPLIAHADVYIRNCVFRI